MTVPPRARPRFSSDPPVLELEPALSRGLDPKAALGAAFHGREGLLLLAERPGVTGALAGTFPALSPGELFGHLIQGLRTGQLLVQTPDARRSVILRDGQVVFAASTARHERLGAVLLARGLVTPEGLEEALAAVRPGARLGQVLVGRQALTAPQLYAAMASLVRGIILSLFELSEGSFLFLEGTPPATDTVKLPERTRELVLEGLQRADALLRLRLRLPGTLCLARGATPPAAGDASLVEAITSSPLQKARARFEGGEAAWLAWVEARLAEGVLARPGATADLPVPSGPMTPPPPMPASAEERYAGFVREVARALLDAGRTLEPLRGFLSVPQEGLEEAFVGVALGDEGTLDVARVAQNLKSGDSALARALALEALDAFASFALFTAKDLLSPEAARALDARFVQLQAEEG